MGTGLECGRAAPIERPRLAIAPREVDELFAIVRKLRARGKTVILITHKLREVFAVTDRITVLRLGRNAGSLVTSATSAREIARLMVGRELRELRQRAVATSSEVVLAVHGLCARSDRGTQALDGVDLTVRGGEVLGIAGVGGNGQSELAECVMGLRSPTAGVVRIGGVDVSREGPRATRASGVSYVPEDRRREGLVLAFTIADNLILGRQSAPPYARLGMLDGRTIQRNGARLAQQFDVRPPNPRAIAGNLSGGNQQKVVLGRELSLSPRLIVVSQPSRGLDIAATEYVHDRLLEQRARGAAILLVSSELDEIRALSDRIAVMYEGRVVATLTAAEATEERLGLLMAGQEDGRGAS